MKSNRSRESDRAVKTINERIFTRGRSARIVVSILLSAFMVFGSLAIVFNAAGPDGNVFSGNAKETVVAPSAIVSNSLVPNVTISGTLPYIPQGAVQESTINLSQTTSVFVGLKIQNNSALNSYLGEVSNPSSILYRHYMSHEQFVHFFEVNDSVYNEVASYYSSMGLTVVRGNDHGYLQVTGTLMNLQKAFNTTFALFKTSLGEYYFNLHNISVPGSLFPYINTAIGFTNYPYFLPAIQLNPALGTNVSTELSALENGSGNGVGLANAQPPYTPYATELAYNESGLISSGVNGAYITIAVTDAFGDPTSTADLQAYDALYNMPATNSYQTVYPYGQPAPVSTVEGSVVGLWEVESALDFQMAHATSPGANIVSVISPDADYTLTQSLVYTITNQLANVISNSWGAPEPEIGNEAQYFHPFAKEAAATGITVLAASGDQGSAGYDTSVPRSVMWPSDDPYVLAVGGTSLFMNGTVSTGTSNPLNGPPSVPEVVNPTGWSNETAWDGYTGGGYSILFAKPSWQTGQGIPTSGKYADRRGVPDVAADAMFAGNLFVFNGVVAGSYAFGGTSFASPLWSGVIATADSYELDYGNGNLLGFVTPTLYSIFNSPVYHKAFHDILYGYNGPNGLFNAGPGWSPVTGLGSPNVGFLTHQLTIMTYSAGVKGDYTSAHAKGISANIMTVIPHTLYGTATDYAYINVTLSDGTQIMLGYTVSAANPDGSWFYAIIPASSVFGSEGYITGPPGSAGVNGTVNTYSITRTSAQDVWAIQMDGKTLADFGSNARSTGYNLPTFSAALAGDYSGLNELGPAVFNDLQFYKNGAWNNIPSVMSYESAIPLTGIFAPYTYPNPLGVSYSGVSGNITMGTGIAQSNGVTLFGTFIPVPPPTVLLTEPDYVTLYAQHVDSVATSGSTSFSMTTEFPAGQHNFNSYYLVPVEGPSSWAFESSQAMNTPLFLSEAVPINAHFFVALSSPASGSITGVVPVTVSVIVSAGGVLIGANSTTHDLSLSGNIQEYNISFYSLLSEVPQGSYISMIVSWYTTSADGTNIGYMIAPQTGAEYPISLSMPTFNPVSITPPGTYSSGGTHYVYSQIQSPFGAYDLKSVDGTVGKVAVPFTVSSNNNYTFAVSSQDLPSGTDHFYINGTDLQGNVNTAISTFSVLTSKGKVTFSEEGLPSGTAWYINLTSSTSAYYLNTGSSSMTDYLAVGAYEYSVATANKMYQPSVYSATVEVTTAGESISVQFKPVTYSVSFTENGVPQGTAWYANITGIPASRPGSSDPAQITYSLQNGTYGFTIASANPNYVPSISSGNLQVKGASISTPISFMQVKFSAVFTESGLPTGSIWYVNLTNGVKNSTQAPYSNVFTLSDGNYEFTVSTSNPAYVPSIDSGVVQIDNGNAKESIQFYAKSSSSQATFNENGLPQGTLWTLALSNGQTFSSITTAITTTLPYGIYAYTVSTPDGSYHGTSGQVNIMSEVSTVDVSFSPVLYNVQIVEQGLAQNVPWSAQINGVAYASSTSVISMELANGTYTVEVGNIVGYSTSASQMVITVHGHDTPQFGVTFERMHVSSSTSGTSAVPVGASLSIAAGGSAGTSGTAYIVAKKFGTKIVQGLMKLFGH